MRPWQTKWADMTKIIPEGEQGNVAIKHFEITEESADFQNMRNAMNGVRGYDCEAGKFIRMMVDRNVMMSNTPMERRTNLDLMDNANGDVLIAGLGLGVVIVPLCKRDDVRSITVIEKNQNVIDLVEPHLRKIPEVDEKLTVILGDIFEWKPTKGSKWDCIYFDIWQDICLDNLEEIRKLHNKFKFRLNRDNPKFFMDSWQKEHLQYLKRAGRWR